MNLLKYGKTIFNNSEVTSITKFGFWLLIDDKEYFVPFAEYTGFFKAKIEDILDFKMLSPNQLYWEKLDIDIEVDALENPRNFPLIFY